MEVLLAMIVVAAPIVAMTVLEGEAIADAIVKIIRAWKGEKK